MAALLKEKTEKMAGANCWPQGALNTSSGVVRGVITKQQEDKKELSRT
jgi:hypothetical protein